MWRNAIATASFLLTLTSWALTFTLLACAFLRVEIEPRLGFTFAKIFAIAGVAFGTALTRATRLEAILAGVMMFMYNWMFTL